MLRRSSTAVAVVALAFSFTAVLAGPPSATNVRIKNSGAAPALVNARNGRATAAGGRTLAGNGIAQFRLRRAAAQAFVQNQAGSKSKTLPFNVGSRPVYVLAAADDNAATLTLTNQRF